MEIPSKKTDSTCGLCNDRWGFLKITVGGHVTKKGRRG